MSSNLKSAQIKMSSEKKKTHPKHQRRRAEKERFSTIRCERDTKKLAKKNLETYSLNQESSLEEDYQVLMDCDNEELFHDTMLSRIVAPEPTANVQRNETSSVSSSQHPLFYSTSIKKKMSESLKKKGLPSSIYSIKESSKPSKSKEIQDKSLCEWRNRFSHRIHLNPHFLKKRPVFGNKLNFNRLDSKNNRDTEIKPKVSITRKMRALKSCYQTGAPMKTYSCFNLRKKGISNRPSKNVSSNHANPIDIVFIGEGCKRAQAKTKVKTIRKNVFAQIENEYQAQKDPSGGSGEVSRKRMKREKLDKVKEIKISNFLGAGSTSQTDQLHWTQIDIENQDQREEITVQASPIDRRSKRSIILKILGESKPRQSSLKNQRRGNNQENSKTRKSQTLRGYKKSQRKVCNDAKGYPKRGRNNQSVEYLQDFPTSNQIGLHMSANKSKTNRLNRSRRRNPIKRIGRYLSSREDSVDESKLLTSITRLIEVNIRAEQNRRNKLLKLKQTNSRKPVDDMQVRLKEGIQKLKLLTQTSKAGSSSPRRQISQLKSMDNSILKRLGAQNRQIERIRGPQSKELANKTLSEKNNCQNKSPLIVKHPQSGETEKGIRLKPNEARMSSLKRVSVRRKETLRLKQKADHYHRKKVGFLRKNLRVRHKLYLKRKQDEKSYNSGVRSEAISKGSNYMKVQQFLQSSLHLSDGDLNDAYNQNS